MARKDVSALRDEAAQAVERGKLKQALELYDELEERQPADAAWPKRIGEVLRKQNKPAEAVTAFERAVDKYVGAGFLVQAIAVAKLILQIDASHPIGSKLAELTAEQRQRPQGPAQVDLKRRGPAKPAAAALQPVPVPAPVPVPDRKPPPVPPPRPAPDLELEPAAIHDRPPRRSRSITLAPKAGIDTVSLAEVMPNAQHLTMADGRPSGIHVIPLDDDDLELSLDDAEDGHVHTAIDAAIDSADLDLDLITSPPMPTPPPTPINVSAGWVPAGPSTGSGPTGGAASPVGKTAALDREARMALLQTPLLAGMSPRVLEALVHKLELHDLVDGEAVFREGDQSTSLYIVSEGEVVVESSAGGELARLAPGAFFGEVALITDLPRSATVRAAGQVELLVIDRRVVNELMAEHPEVLGVLLRFIRDRLVHQVLRTSALFRPFAEPERKELATKFELVEVDAGSVMIVQGERADGLYVMLAGRAEVWRDGVDAAIAALGPGEVFGEMSLLGGGGATAHVRSATKVLALRMPAKVFQGVIMTHPPVLEYVGTLAEQRAPAEAVEGDMVDLRLDFL